MLDNIRIVLINTFHPGNIGAAARALKTMGLSQLYLVNPHSFPHPDAESRAAGGKIALDNAVVVETLEEAIQDCSLVIGTSARNRSFPWPQLDPRSCAEKVRVESTQAQVAIVFGRERMGMHNDELMQCNFHVAIPSDPACPVLNIAAAVQVIGYEIWLAHQQESVADEGLEYPSNAELNHFYAHLEQALTEINFIIPQHPGNLMTKLRRFFNRARPEKKELNMLRGILTAVQRHNSR